MSEKRTNKHTETHARDLISREKAIDAVNAWLLLRSLNRTMSNVTSLQDVLRQLPSAKPEKVLVAEIKIDAEMLQRTVERIAEKTRKELDLQILGGEEDE